MRVCYEEVWQSVNYIRTNWDWGGSGNWIIQTIEHSSSNRAWNCPIYKCRNEIALKLVTECKHHYCRELMCSAECWLNFEEILRTNNVRRMRDYKLTINNVIIFTINEIHTFSFAPKNILFWKTIKTEWSYCVLIILNNCW